LQLWPFFSSSFEILCPSKLTAFSAYESVVVHRFFGKKVGGDISFARHSLVELTPNSSCAMTRVREKPPYWVTFSKFPFQAGLEYGTCYGSKVCPVPDS